MRVYLLSPYIEFRTDVTCCCKTAEATLVCRGIIEVIISLVISRGRSVFSWIASAGTFIVKTRFSTSFGWGGSVICMGINFLGSNADCWIVFESLGGFEAVEGCDVVGCWSDSVFIAVVCWFFAACVVFGTVGANGGMLLVLAFPFTDAKAFFCSSVDAFFDFVPLAYRWERYRVNSFIINIQIKAR